LNVCFELGNDLFKLVSRKEIDIRLRFRLTKCLQEPLNIVALRNNFDKNVIAFPFALLLVVAYGARRMRPMNALVLPNNIALLNLFWLFTVDTRLNKV